MNTFTAVVLLGCMACCMSADEFICEDNSARYTPNMFWMAEPNNCHMYVVCEPLGAGLYKVNEMSCGDLYWSAEVRTCVREIPASATCDREATALPTDVTTTEYPFECNFVVNPKNAREYKPKDSGNRKYTIYQSCPKYFHFSLAKCTCLKNSNAPANACDNRCFLNFHFDNDFTDSSCTNAVAHVATGKIGFSASTHGQGALFDGTGYLDIPAMRGIFAGHYMTAFSISLYFKTNNTARSELIFDNGDRSHDMSVLFGYLARKNIMSAQVHVSADFGTHRRSQLINIEMPLTSSPTEWTHVVYVYDNNKLSLTINGHVTKTKSFVNLHKKQYTIDDLDEPLSLGGRSSGDFYFNGMIDEFKVFKRALSATEIIALYHDRF